MTPAAAGRKLNLDAHYKLKSAILSSGSFRCDCASDRKAEVTRTIVQGLHLFFRELDIFSLNMVTSIRNYT